MERQHALRYALTICVATALLGACGGSQPPIGAPGAMPQSRAIATHTTRSGSWMLPEAKKSPEYQTVGPLVYVSDYTRWEVTVYHANAYNPAPIATIIDGLNSPAGECIDSHGTLYVTNEPISGAGWISEYPLGKTEPSVTIMDSGSNTPLYCAIDGNNNLWVTSINRPNNVTEYLYGSTRPHFVLTEGLTYPDGIAVDHAGNVYVGNLAPPSSSNIQVFAPGSKTPYRTITDSVTWPVGIAIDSSDTLYVANLEQNNVEEYLSGQDHPYRAISHGLHLPAGMAFNAKGWMYVANNGNGAKHNDIVEFPSGSIMPSRRRIKNDVYAANDVAHYPAVLP